MISNKVDLSTSIGGRNQCPTCGKVFRSNTAFDFHRAGEYSSLNPDGLTYSPSKRRCMTTEEMLAKGMGQQESGTWVTELATEEDKQRLRAIPQ